MGKGQKGFLISAFDRALAWPIATAGWRGKTFAMAYALSSDFNPLQVGALASFWNSRHIVGRLMRAIDKIDDRVDAADPHVVSLADFSRDENGVSNFLHDRRFVPREYLSLCKKLDEAGVVPYDESIAYSNIFCDLLQERAFHQLIIQKGHDVGLREDIMQGNLTLASVYGCYVFGMINRTKEAASKEISIENLQKIYPEIYHINHSAQMLDDLRDIMIDLEDEVKTGVVSPNAILSRALLTHSNREEIYGFVREGQEREEFPANTIPAGLKNGIASVGRDFYVDMLHVRSAGSRAILESFWRNTAAETIKTSRHPEVQRKARIEAAGYENIL